MSINGLKTKVFLYAQLLIYKANDVGGYLHSFIRQVYLTINKLSTYKFKGKLKLIIKINSLL